MAFKIIQYTDGGGGGGNAQQYITTQQQTYNTNHTFNI